MSQAKVDRYKEEKKNRAKELKKAKIKKKVAAGACICIAGFAIGIPIGRGLYKAQQAARAARATISADSYTVWSQNYWSNNYKGILASLDAANTSTATDATKSDATKTDASKSDAK